jgi:hypothetical protein
LQQTLPPKQEGVYTASVPPDSEKLQDAVLEALHEFKLFKEIKKVEGRAESLQTAIELAAAVPTDLILIPKIKQFNVTYAGRNGVHYPKLVLWSLIEWASWFMADELYRIDMTCEFELRRGHDRNHLDTRISTTSLTKPISDIQRGIKIWGAVRVPGALHKDNFRKVGSTLLPHAARDMQVNILRNVMPAFRKVIQTSEVLKPAPKAPTVPGETTGLPLVPEVKQNAACIFGVDSYNELTLAPLSTAASDAKAFKEFLAASANPDYAASNLVLRVNQDATLAGMKRVLDEFVAMANKKKLGSAVFYFAGRGALARTETGDSAFYILPSDADITNLDGTALSLKLLASNLHLVNAEQVIIILDCGFDPSGAGRCAPTGAGFKGPVQFPEVLYSPANYSLLSAAAPGAPAFDSPALKAGLLTNFLIKAAHNPKLFGTSNTIEMRRLHEYLSTMVPAEANKLGATQEPGLFGSGAANTLFGKKE